mmetsp:Transcript_1000/g.3394  ORF Transcript_1000/g.3394 Transcript_1000/m.3394 type:complete len:276 (-) Transcript_1000:1059-1886(-)
MRRIQVVLDDEVVGDFVVEDGVDDVVRVFCGCHRRKLRQQREVRVEALCLRPAAPDVNETVLLDRGIRFRLRLGAVPVLPGAVVAELPAVVPAGQATLAIDAAHGQRRRAMGARVHEAHDASVSLPENHEGLVPEPRRVGFPPAPGLVEVRLRQLARKAHGVPRAVEARSLPAPSRARRRDREVGDFFLLLLLRDPLRRRRQKRRSLSSFFPFIQVVGRGEVYGAAPPRRVVREGEVSLLEERDGVVLEGRREHGLEGVRHDDRVVEVLRQNVVL